jgi:WD40 repeat protein
MTAYTFIYCDSTRTVAVQTRGALRQACQSNLKLTSEIGHAAKFPIRIIARSPVFPFPNHSNNMVHSRIRHTNYVKVKRTEIKKLLSSRSDRVKAVDFHPTENWILCALYNGKVNIYNYDTQLILRTFPITDVPVRAGRFIARKNWIVTGSDDFQLVFPRY